MSDGLRSVLLITLMHPDTDGNQMLEAFGAPRLNLYRLVDVSRERPEYTIKFQTAPRQIQTQSFADTLTIARFLLSDRERAAFFRFPSVAKFEAYMRSNGFRLMRAKTLVVVPNAPCLLVIPEDPWMESTDLKRLSELKLGEFKNYERDGPNLKARPGLLDRVQLSRQGVS